MESGANTLPVEAGSPSGRVNPRRRSEKNAAAQRVIGRIRTGGRVNSKPGVCDGWEVDLHTRRALTRDQTESIGLSSGDCWDTGI